MVSAGNTGAAMASALLRMGRIKGVKRPAIATVLPVPGSTRATVLLDAGANAECQPEWLVQFAQMGSVFARHRFGLDPPEGGPALHRRGETKGNTLVKETYALLEDAPGVTFIGNVEGRDILTDDVDIVVTDGFSGNVVLKSLEGALPAIMNAVVQALTSTDDRAAPFEPLRPVLDGLYESLEPESFGGAMLLGVHGVCIISHGSSSAKAMFNAIKMARKWSWRTSWPNFRRPSPDDGSVPPAATMDTRPTQEVRRAGRAPCRAGAARPQRHLRDRVDRLADILEIEPATISEGQSFVDDLDADSLALIQSSKPWRRSPVSAAWASHRGRGSGRPQERAGRRRLRARRGQGGADTDQEIHEPSGRRLRLR